MAWYTAGQAHVTFGFLLYSHYDYNCYSQQTHLRHCRPLRPSIRVRQLSLRYRRVSAVHAPRPGKHTSRHGGPLFLVPVLYM